MNTGAAGPVKSESAAGAAGRTSANSQGGGPLPAALHK
jgi:hypothetical protein